MATSKKTTASKTASKAVESASPTNDRDDAANAAFARVKDAIPSMDGLSGAASDVTDYLQNQANADLKRLADDASDFVRRNPGTSLAAAAGLGILIGVLASKRS